MTFALTKFRAYGIEADEPLNKRDLQVAVFNITAANTDSSLGIGNYAGTFWTDVGSSMPGALKAIKDIQTQAESFTSCSVPGYTQIGASGRPGSFSQILSAASAGGSVTEELVVSGLTPSTVVVSVDQYTQGPAQNTFYSAISSAITGGAAAVTATVAGILKTDVVMSVTQQVDNANSKQIVSYESSPAVAGKLDVVYTADPGNDGKVNVMWKRAGGNPIVAVALPDTDKLSVTWAKDPGAGAKVLVTIPATTSTIDIGAYTVVMNLSNDKLPDISFLTGDAPTSYVLVLQWKLKDGALPIAYAA